MLFCQIIHICGVVLTYYYTRVYCYEVFEISAVSNYYYYFPMILTLGGC